MNRRSFTAGILGLVPGLGFLKREKPITMGGVPIKTVPTLDTKRPLCFMSIRKISGIAK